MDKVIELLNAYGKEKHPKTKLRYYKYDSLHNEFLSNYPPTDSVEKVLGKRFGFIKRLVENDKIELKAGPLYGFQPIMSNRQPFTIYETLLMLLSIEDNPIEFLCSVLK